MTENVLTSLCSHFVSYSQQEQVCKDGDSMASLGNLWQVSGQPYRRCFFLNGHLNLVPSILICAHCSWRGRGSCIANLGERKKVLDYNKSGNLVAKMLNFHGTVQISRFYSLEEGNPSSPNRDRWGSSHLSELQLKAAWKMRERVLCQHMLSACSQLYLYMWVQENSLLSEACWVSPAQFCGDEWIPQESFTAAEHIKSGTWINWLG